MSRSRKKTPISGIASADSEKQDKRKANRRVRRVNKVAVATDDEPKLKREVSDVWSFDKDGKRWSPNTDMRK